MRVNALRKFEQYFRRRNQRSLETLFVADPRYQARLSTRDDMNEAVEEVLRRVLSQCRLTWELGLFSSSDRRSFGIRLMVLMQDHLYEYLSQKDEESMMSSSHFHHFDSFYRFLNNSKESILGLIKRCATMRRRFNVCPMMDHRYMAAD